MQPAERDQNALVCICLIGYDHRCTSSYVTFGSIESGMSDRKPPRSVWSVDLTFNIETERETDGRWIAEIVDIPGVLAYGASEEEAKAKAYALALRVIADRVEESRSVPKTIKVATPA